MKIQVKIYEEIKKPLISWEGSLAKPIFEERLTWVEGVPYEVTIV